VNTYLITRARITAAVTKDAPARLDIERAHYIAGELEGGEPPPPRPRGPVPHWIRAVVAAGMLNEDIADLVLSVCLQVWQRAEGDPSATTIATAIGSRLIRDAYSRVGWMQLEPAKLGYDLLQFAYLAGVAYEGRSVSTTHKVYLAGDALALLPRRPNAGLRRGVDVKPPKVTRVWDATLPPFEPIPGSPPLQAVERIRRTKWRINTDMVPIAARYLDAHVPAAFKKQKLTARERYEARHHMVGLDALREAQEGRQTGYFRARFDHRGRVYQEGNALTFTSGGDVARALLEFGQRRRVQTEAGRRALAQHLIGHHGSRVEHDTELDWIADNKSLIEDAATQPREHTLCFVAACRAWLAVERGEPIGLPVQIDATTSALQHMALLLRNRHLAEVSNLLPGPRRDVYTEIGALMPQHLTLPREAVKACSMPMFYGQTVESAIKRLVKVDDLKHLHGTDWRETRGRLRAIAEQVRQATRDSLPEAFLLYWRLRDVAGAFARRGEVLGWKQGKKRRRQMYRGEPVRWVTPSGWECVLEPRVAGLQIKETTTIDGDRVPYSLRHATPEMSAPRLRNAITANVIHSLDAALLHLAVAELPEGASIGTAHDCFAVHADDVPVMRAALMGALRRMYADDDLLAGWFSLWGCDGLRVGTWEDDFLTGRYAFC
jgi:DNA-dependent RNA polymerase-like protein